MTLNKFGYSSRSSNSGFTMDELDLMKKVEQECMARGIDVDMFLTKAYNSRRR
jgi:hypothetical protein